MQFGVALAQMNSYNFRFFARSYLDNYLCEDLPVEG